MELPCPTASTGNCNFFFALAQSLNLNIAQVIQLLLCHQNSHPVAREIKEPRKQFADAVSSDSPQYLQEKLSTSTQTPHSTYRKSCRLRLRHNCVRARLHQASASTQSQGCMTFAIWFSLKRMELLQNGLQPHSEATICFHWFPWEASSQHWLCVDADAWYKRALITWCLSPLLDFFFFFSLVYRNV